MARALGEIFTHKVDYADLYFQYTAKAGAWKRGIVKTGSFSISQGVGVRAVSGEKTAFAYSDSLSADALLSSAHAVRGIARRGAGKVRSRPRSKPNTAAACMPISIRSRPSALPKGRAAGTHRTHGAGARSPCDPGHGRPGRRV